MSVADFCKESRFNECFDGCLDLNGALRTALANFFETLVPFAEVLCFEGTVGITVDKKKTLLLHFSEMVNKKVVVSGSLDGDDHRTVSRDLVRDFNGGGWGEAAAENYSHFQTKERKMEKDDWKHSLLQTLLHRTKKKYCSDDGFVAPGKKDSRPFAEGVCMNSSPGEPNHCRKRARLSKIPPEITASASSNGQVTDVDRIMIDQDPLTAPSGGQFYVNVEHGCAEDVASQAALRCSRAESDLQSQPSDDDDNDDLVEVSDGNDRTLLRQLLQSKKSNRNRQQKRKFGASEEYLPSVEKHRVSAFTFKENGNGSSVYSSEIPPELQTPRSVRISSLRSSSLRKIADVPRTEQSGDEVASGKRSLDSILCRLLTSGVTMYDTTEVERLREASLCSSKEPVSLGMETATNSISSPFPRNVKLENEMVSASSRGLIKTEPVENPRNSDVGDLRLLNSENVQR